MQQFTDTTGDRWTVHVTYGMVQQIRAKLDLDLITLVDGSLLQKLAVDPPMIINALYQCCKDEADERGLTPEEFGQRFDGEVLDSGCNALIQSTIDFFPKMTRQHIREAIKKMEMAQLESLKILQSTETDQLIRQLVRDAGTKGLQQLKESSVSSGSWPAS